MLLKSPSAAGQSMGNAFAAVSADAGGIGSIHYNPASAAFLKRGEFFLMGRNGIADDTFGGFIFGRPARMGTVTGGFSLYRIGDIDLTDPQGRARTVRAQEDMLANLNYSKSVNGRLALGVSLKYLRSELAQTVSASAIAADLGAQYRMNRLSFGLAAQNLGQGMKYGSSTEPLPAMVRGGVTHTSHFDYSGTPGRLMASFDISKQMDSNLKKSVGLEYFWNNMVALRTGTQFDGGAGQLQIGVGFAAGQMQFDYDHLSVGDLNGEHTVTATYKFGKEVSSRRKP